MRTRSKKDEEKKTVSLTVKVTPTFREEIDEVFPYGDELADKIRTFLAEQIQIRKAAKVS